jgi:twinkle protein
MSKTTRTHLPCPSCNSSDALSEYDDGHSFCFSCNQYFPGKELDETYTTQAMVDWRGIYASTFQHYNVKCKVDATGAIDSIGFPYPGGTFKVRKYANKAFYSKGIVKPGLFGRDRFAAGSHSQIIITEGELDALSAYQVCRCPCVSVRSASSGLTDARTDRSYLDSFQRIYLAFDADEPGSELTRNVARLFDYNKVYHVRLGPYKDANDFLVHGKASELATVIRNAKRYLPETIVSSFSDFKVILESQEAHGVPYPFPTLNEMTYGMRTGESVLVTAQEGIGKTEFMHALEYQLLSKTGDAVGAIFLEEAKKRHLQAIAGLKIGQPVHLPDCGYSNDQVLSAVQEVVQVDDRLHIYSHFGSDDPDILLDTIRFMVSARSVRWVLLDHITMVVSALAGMEDERRKLDYLSTKLQMMLKELDFGLIMVSHVNDFGETRGSRYVSKIADIRIDLERDLHATNETTRNTTNLHVSKNRFSGRTGPAGKLYFDSNSFTFSELSMHDPGEEVLSESKTERVLL